jgi:SAM-dependent methyltransferase
VVRRRILPVAVCAALLAAVPAPRAQQQTGERAASRAPDIFFVPTSEAVADQMLQLASITAKDVVYDLGSGDGRILVLAAQKYGARGVGIEIQPRLVETARQVARQGEVADRVEFIEGDLFTADISAATLVTIYLSPGVNAKLEPKLKAELRPGTRIVSHQFGIGKWTPEQTVPARDGTDLYLWTIPPR